MFTLKQLAVFDAVARLGSVSEAADELAMTQPAASMSVQQLEKLLGTQLFVRTQKRLLLSEQGKLLHPMARSMLIDAADLGSRLSQPEQIQSIKIGASATIADYLLENICVDFLERHPRCNISISVMSAFDIINKVDEMALDVGLVEFVSIRPSLDVIRWRTDSLVIFCAPEHELAQREKLRAEDLTGYLWCLQRRYADTRRQFALALLNRIDTFALALESDSLQVIRAAVAANLGLGCLPRPCIARELEQGTLRALDVKGLDMPFPMSIVSRKDLKKSSVLSAFIDQARDALR